MSYKAHFSRFLAADPARLHFAAHSHHLWPDVTFEAQQHCWEDAARLADRKWEMIFGEVVPKAQRHVARTLSLDDPGTVAFAPNTHEFVLRLLSCLPPARPARVLTTDSEFHSFRRQTARLSEDGLVDLEMVPTEPFASFPDRFAAAAAAGGHDLVFVSQVFYNSGYGVPDPAALVAAVPDSDTFIVIDGYHGFLALPTDFSALADRAFYLGGGYKYAMAGEGAAFVHAPPGFGPRPRNTGWFAAFGALETGEGGGVDYGNDATRFVGATFDPSGLYRFNAVMDWLEEIGLEVADIHAHVAALQAQFTEGLAVLSLDALHPGQLVVTEEQPVRGHFLTFRTPGAEEIYQRLMAADVITDYRGDRLRFGFGLYQDAEDVDKLCAVLGRLFD